MSGTESVSFSSSSLFFFLIFFFPLSKTNIPQSSHRSARAIPSRNHFMLLIPTPHPPHPGRTLPLRPLRCVAAAVRVCPEVSKRLRVGFGAAVPIGMSPKDPRVSCLVCAHCAACHLLCENGFTWRLIGSGTRSSTYCWLFNQ